LSKRRFAFKLDLCRSLGALPESHASAVIALNRIRNDLAHKERYKVSLGDLKGLQVNWSPEEAAAFDKASAKGVGEAARIACLYLTLTMLKLLEADLR